MSRRRSSWLVAVLLLVGAAGCSSASRTHALPTAEPPTPSVSAARGAAAKHYVPHPIPAALVALDVSWVSRSAGWLLGAEGCGRFQCVALYNTRDGGHGWSRARTPHPRLVQSAGVRFVDARTGYFFSGPLFMTNDGGRHWSRQHTENVSDLLPVGDTMLALTYDHSGCPGPCDVRVERAQVGASSWSTVMSTVPQAGYTTLAGESGGVVAVEEGNRASASAKGSLAFSPDGGGHWSQRVDPCGTRGRREYDLVDATAVGGAVTVMCGPHVGADREFTTRSSDAGRHFGAPAWLPRGSFGTLTSLGGDRLVASTQAVYGSGRTTYLLVVSYDRGASWRQVLSAGEPVYDQPEQAAGRSALISSTNGIITYIADGVHAWRSDDAGRTWQPLAMP